MSTKPETIFQEHWRRFFLLPQVDASAVRQVSGALYWNDQLLWSLGVIPWGSWRLPFQKSVHRLLHEALPFDAPRLYAAINTALATAQGDFLSPPTEADKQSLVQRVEQFCEGETAAHLLRQIQAVTPQQPVFGNAVLEALLQRVSGRYRSRFRQRDSAYYACLFHFRVLDVFLERLAPLPAGENQAIRNCVALICWQALFDAEPEPVQLFSEKRLMADQSHLSGEIYNFWSWQYTYRNPEYRKLRAVLEPFLHGSDAVSIMPRLPVSNLKEYQTITGRLEAGACLAQELFATCNQAIDALVEKFGYYPAWPIIDYTSDFIVSRMLAGKFHYWERESPPPLVERDAQCQLCLRDASRCTLEARKVQEVRDGHGESPICSAECVAAVQQEEQRLYRAALNEERGRIRAEPLHRMLGLWLWDHCQEYGTTPAEAMRTLEERHFPESNSHWQPPETGTGKNLDWYDFRELTTARPTLYADYQDACRCIEAAKFLPRLRGVKKNRNPVKSKDRNRK
ncbi:MAG: hypothetical protein HDQ92_03490 [Desulfovibrio sp.]|nr:hypothetical protein [Desulfovibrio sp.]